MTEDKQLVQEIISGSEAAMEILTKRYYKPIFAFVYRKVGNKDIAYDLTQEIFIKMMKRIHSYSCKGSFKSWLYTLAINHCRDYWRSTDYKIASKQRELPESISSKQNDIPYIFEKKQTREKVKAAIEELPNFQKEAVLLKYFHDLKIKEIAKITEAKESTVKSRLSQGLSKLEDIFKRGEKHEQKRT